MSAQPTIRYTYTDEAPALATASFLPIIEAFAGAAGVKVETRDISLAGRVLAVFPDYLTEEQKVGDALAELGELAKTPAANIIKLPNISASIPQLKATIDELQGAGYAIPDYPEEPQTDAERDIQARYNKVKGSAVNPVLREGNSDRRAPRAVKDYARSHPHSMGAWSSDSTTHVATMGANDFRSNEVSTTMTSDDSLTITHVADDGASTVLRTDVPVSAGEVVDATFMSREALVSFLRDQVADAATSSTGAYESLDDGSASGGATSKTISVSTKLPLPLPPPGPSSGSEGCSTASRRSADSGASRSSGITPSQT